MKLKELHEATPAFGGPDYGNLDAPQPANMSNYVKVADADEYELVPVNPVTFGQYLKANNLELSQAVYAEHCGDLQIVVEDADWAESFKAAVKQLYRVCSSMADEYIERDDSYLKHLSEPFRGESTVTMAAFKEACDQAAVYIMKTAASEEELKRG